MISQPTGVDLACTATPDAFFPSSRRTREVLDAQRLCVSCPMLAECAAWAAPLVERRELDDCVIASVHLPSYRRPWTEFARAADALRALSRRVSAARNLEGAA
jgi:hypothetical protein